MSDEFAQLTAEVDTVLSEIDRDVNIVRSVGYQPDVLEKKLADIEAAGEVKAAKVLDTWADLAQMRTDRARRDLLAMPPADPLLRLTGEELQRATLLRPWLAEQVAAGDPGPLAARVESAIARKDRGEALALMWETARRLDAERAAHDGMLPRAWQDLAGLLEQAESTFVPDSERAKRQKLQEDLDAATNLQTHVDAERLRLPSQRRALADTYGLRYAGVKW